MVWAASGESTALVGEAAVSWTRLRLAEVSEMAAAAAAGFETTRFGQMLAMAEEAAGLEAGDKNLESAEEGDP